jgi:hypothetical protein
MMYSELFTEFPSKGSFLERVIQLNKHRFDLDSEFCVVFFLPLASKIQAMNTNSRVHIDASLDTRPMLLH